MSRIKVALLFGGRSGEHEVSRNSAAAVGAALSKTYDLTAIGIAKDGQWYGPIPLDDVASFEPRNYPDRKITIIPTPQSAGTLYSLPDLEPVGKVQVFFPILHGTHGEDGTIQGLLELAEVPYVGAGVAASSVGMDKILMKNIFAAHGLPQVGFIEVLRSEIENNPAGTRQKVEAEIGYPCFVKPANMGSSVGINKAENEKELDASLCAAAKYDRKIIIEKGVNAREIEISVLGNDSPLVSVPGEIVPCNEFYDYNAKYIDDKSALYIPASLTDEQVRIIQEYAVRAYRAIDCAGMARVDFFLTKDSGEILVNEINTLPGFTAISMYPKLWDYSGIKIEELVKRLVELALERSADLRRNATSYEV